MARMQKKEIRILVVDDEPIIALEIASIAQEAGWNVTAMAHNVADALKVIEQNGCDAAILDANLRGTTAAPIAQLLRDVGLPFVVVTGYFPDQIGDWVGDAVVLTKPFDPQGLKAHLSSMAKADRDRPDAR